MYEEEYEYEERGFPIRDFLLKLIIIVILVFLLVWLLPKFITPTVKNSNCVNNKNCSIKLQKSNKEFDKNLNNIKDAAISYYNKNNLPKNNNESNTMTVETMIKKNLINKLPKEYNLKKSYVNIKKVDDKYILKTYLVSKNKKDYKIINLGVYNYCKTYICEKDSTKSNEEVVITPNKKTTNEEISNTASKSLDQKNNDNNQPDNKETINTPTTDNKNTINPNKVYKYEYKKEVNSKLSNWTAWSEWTKTSCDTKEINCSDQDSNCLKKLQRYNHKEQIGTYDKKYVVSRQEIRQVGTKTKEACSNYNYVIIKNKLYTVSKPYYSLDSWKLVESNKEFTTAPNDTETYHYKFVSGTYYNVYKYTGAIRGVVNTTSVTDVKSCGKISNQAVQVYDAITVSDTLTKKEPLYGTVCYESIKTRDVIYSGYTKTKWSKYNDLDLLNDNWHYTGKTKAVN